MEVERVNDKGCYGEILNLWEDSVRATHHFLKEEDIQYYKGNIRKHYLNAVSLFVIRDEKEQILGFMGTSDDSIEMLFIDPKKRGRGIGKRFVEYAISKLNIQKVDVNEQNEQAIVFYLKMGFIVESQSPLDGEGKPYPILHMNLKVALA